MLIMFDIEVINSSTENNEHNQTSNENKIMEEHKKNEIKEVYKQSLMF